MRNWPVADGDSLHARARADVVRMFEGRPGLETFDYRDIGRKEHLLAFTIAKSTGYNIIEDIRGALRDPIVNRGSFEDFQKRLTPTLQQKGWWGRKEATDPLTGEVSTVQLGSPRRLRTIYWANVASAEAVGEWAQIEATKEFLPYLTYLISLSDNKRREHLQFVGITLLVDDPWWRTHYPPNGWMCKCRARQISGPKAMRQPEENRRPPRSHMREWRNRRTGEIEMVPEGLDPAWAHNPGLMRERTLSRHLADTLDRLPEAPRRAAVQKILDHPLAQAIARGEAHRGNHLPVAVLPESLKGPIGAKTSIVRASGEIGAKSQKPGRSGQPHHPEATPESYRIVQEAIDTGRVIQEGDRKLLVDFPAELHGFWWRASLTASTDGTEVFLSTWFYVRERQHLNALERPHKGGGRSAVVLQEGEER